MFGSSFPSAPRKGKILFYSDSVGVEMYPEEKPCAIWGTPARAWKDFNFKGEVFDSPRAGGKYRLSIYVTCRTLENMIDAEKARLTNWIVNQHREGVEEPEITMRVIDNISNSQVLNLSEKTRRFFLYLLNENPIFGQKFLLDSDDPSNKYSWREFHKISAWIGSYNNEETNFFLSYMSDKSYISLNLSRQYFTLTMQGWDKLEEYCSSNPKSKQVFVAMWFGGKFKIEQMNDVYENGLKPGIETETGYTAIRIDRVEHNERIEDQIIAEIIRSKFIVADFTCDDFEVGGIKKPDVRGGVYYEAGFAHGLDKTVIFTCREDCQQHVHFDTSHFNHIFWKDVDDLKTKLNNRIRRTLSLSNP